MLRATPGGPNSDTTGARLSRVCYRIALYAYPRAFREAYGPLLEQALRDMLQAEQAGIANPTAPDGTRPRDRVPTARLIRLWGWVFVDLAQSATAERILAMHDRKWLFWLAPALLVGLGIGIVDSRPHWDDTGITAMALLAASAVLGILQPRR